MFTQGDYMSENSQSSKEEQAKVLQDIIAKLAPLDDDSRNNIFKTIGTFFEIEMNQTAYSSKASSPVVSRSMVFSDESDNSDLSSKEFLLDKKPKSDIERVVCLAYYLTHYRNTPHFKTIDISKLNTEAAQLKFSNPAHAVENASRRGFLVPAGKNGMKQISAVGEQFVAALPDRENAKVALENVKAKSRKISKKAKIKSNPLE